MNHYQKNTRIKTTIINLSGLIQGVGFRPFVYKLAKSNNLNGQVINRNNGVEILLQGNEKNISDFVAKLKIQAPKAAIITQINTKNVYQQEFSDFTIADSETIDNSITIVGPDIAVCDECLNDMKQQPHRIGYPFTNCTNCGPRFSIIRDIPYDRDRTSMKAFKMCPVCKSEYTNINNRRFHAQPVACNSCGPVYILQIKHKTIVNLKEILHTISAAINAGDIVAMKGLGGFHLACNPYNKKALKKLRQIKARDSKPFAIMVNNIETASKLASLTAQEKKRLLSWQRPIVLVKSKKENEFPEDIACGLKTLGIFLPYLPFHYQLFEYINLSSLVMTSANLSNCPIIIDEKEAIDHFQQFEIPILYHNREIVNRVDDSVELYGPLGKQISRRSRGYAPLPLLTQIDVEGILATGAELNGAFALGKEKQIILSQYIGDLKNFETMQFYEESYRRLKELFKFSPSIIACDMHPDYLSTTFAHQLNLPVIPVQHHHAHIAACMAEFGIDEKVIGIAYDGTGYGTDRKIWGSEIMVADYLQFERKFHFEYVPVPGGDKVAEEPWRSAYAYLYHAGNGQVDKGLEFLQSVKRQHIELIHQALENKINVPVSCSAGRLFDAVAALVNICTHTSYHAEAPIKLENQVADGIKDYYPVELQGAISWAHTIKAIVSDIQKKVHASVIAAKFHNSVARITCNAIMQLKGETGINKVVLSGGTFQNMYLTKKIVDLLKNTGVEIFMSRQIPCNDGGIAAGQMAIVSKKNELCV